MLIHCFGMDAAPSWEQRSGPTFLVIECGTLRTSRAERFRANAVECERQAVRSPDARLKAQFTDLASQWRYLAEQVERIAYDRGSALKTLRTVVK